MQSARVLLTADHVVVRATHDPIADGAVLVEDGRIAAVGPRTAVQRAAPSATVVPHPGCVLLPGLVDAHSHLRGLPTAAHEVADAPLERWIVRLHGVAALDPFDEAIVAADGLLGAGITTVQALHHTFAPPDTYVAAAVATATALASTGLHGELTLGLTDQGEYVPPHEEATLPDDLRRWLVPTRGCAPADLAALVQRVEAAVADLAAAHPTWLRTGISPVGPQWASDTLLAEVARLLGDRRLHTHAVETAVQRTWVGESPVARLDRHGLLGPATSFAHGLHLTPDELRRVAARSVAVAPCPTSNRRMARSTADVVAWRRLGVTVGLGLDSNTASDPPDVFEELRQLVADAASLGQQLSGRDALEMATLGGAVAVGRAGRIGHLDVGADADLSVVAVPGASRAEDPVEHLVATASRTDVREVRSRGRLVHRAGRLAAGPDVASTRQRLVATLASSRAERAEIRRATAAAERYVAKLLERHHPESLNRS